MNNSAHELAVQELEPPIPLAEYNYDHFLRRHFTEDVQRTMRKEGLEPGAPAPDFTLPQVGGEDVRLSSLRGRPVLLHFVSYT